MTPTPATHGHGHRGKVLVVDDSSMMRFLCTTYLRRGGFEVVEAVSGHTALDALELFEPDVVVTDFNMPGLDGFGLIERLKDCVARPEVILITASGEMEVAVRARDMGAHDCLTKPLPGADQLVQTVERAVEKKRGRDARS